MSSTPTQSITEAQLALLAAPLDALSPTGPVEVAEATTIRRDVYRLALHGASYSSVVVKRMWGLRARIETRVTERWLPAAGLDGLGPPRLITVGDPDGLHSWHVYDDLGPCGLDRAHVAAELLTDAMVRVAELHAAFARSPLLPEPRFAAGDMGAHFYARSVRDAFRSVDMLRAPVVAMSREDEVVRDAMLTMLRRVLDDEPRRLWMIEHQAGPETLVHGDLIPANVFVMPDGVTPRVRLIDWDHCGVAPAGFDISTHVARYPAPERQLALEVYRTAMAERGFPFPDDLDWDFLVATFEVGRLCNQVIWVALGIIEGNGWSFGDLAAWHAKLSAAVDHRADRLDGELV